MCTHEEGNDVQVNGCLFHYPANSSCGANSLTGNTWMRCFKYLLIHVAKYPVSSQLKVRKFSPGQVWNTRVFLRMLKLFTLQLIKVWKSEKSYREKHRKLQTRSTYSISHRVLWISKLCQPLSVLKSQNSFLNTFSLHLIMLDICTYVWIHTCICIYSHTDIKADTWKPMSLITGKCVIKLAQHHIQSVCHQQVFYCPVINELWCSLHR